MFFQRAAGRCKAAGQTLPTRLGVLLVKPGSQKRVFPLQMRVRRFKADGEEEWYRVSFWLSSLACVRDGSFFIEQETESGILPLKRPRLVLGRNKNDDYIM